MTSSFALFNNSKNRQAYRSDAELEQEGFQNEMTKHAGNKNDFGSFDQMIGAHLMPFMMLGMR